jgi:hypothetical protein
MITTYRNKRGRPPATQAIPADKAPRYIPGRYVDKAFSERPCDKCGKPYRGPAVYCSLTCALADA